MQYDCKKGGTTRFNGKVIRFIKGTEEYPDGSLDHVGACRMMGRQKTAVVTQAETKETIYPEKSKPLDGTVKVIKAWLDENGIEYPSGAKKPELIEILQHA